MKDQKQHTPVDVGTAPAFPPTDVPNLSTIADSTPTTASDGAICDAYSTADNFADVAPNGNE